MTRTTASVARKKHRSKIHQLAKGFRGRSKNCYRVAVEKVEKALQYAYRDRRTKKRNFRSLWIQRINAAVRVYDINYSEFINLLTKKNMEIDRKILSDIAIKKPELFAEIVNQAKAS